MYDFQALSDLKPLWNWYILNSLFPLVVDTFGGWHKDSLEVITKLGRQVSRQTGKEEDEIVRQLRQRVAILLVRDNVNMFDSRTPSYPQAVIDADVDINV